MNINNWKIYNQSGLRRVIVTKELPGEKWINILTRAGCRVEICTSKKEILGAKEIISAMDKLCDGVIGQLTEKWDRELLLALKNAGGKVYSNYAVGYDNVDIETATELGIAVGNTPGVLTEATSELAIALTFACARRIIEADTFMRSGKFKGWLPDLFLGELLNGKTLGIIGAGRIGSAYARIMVVGLNMDLIYYDVFQNKELERYITELGKFLNLKGKRKPNCTRAVSIEEVLKKSDVVSIHTILNESTYHLINAPRLRLMKKNAILINTSRGPLIDETALVEHLKQNPDFRVGLDVYEDEPIMKPGLSDMKNAVIVPHIGSATRWTRGGMAVLAALNIAAILKGYPVWSEPQNILPFLGKNPPKAAPSIVNAQKLNIPFLIKNKNDL